MIVFRISYGFIIAIVLIYSSLLQESSNGCCVTSPCLNGGTCHKVHGQKRRLQCNCQSGFAGELCGTKARSCVDRLKANRSVTPGVYTIQDEHNAAFSSVYCDFDKAGRKKVSYCMCALWFNSARRWKGGGGGGRLREEIFLHIVFSKYLKGFEIRASRFRTFP